MVILGLGSNKGDRLGYLRAAVDKLRVLLGELHLSRVLESAALLPPGAPPEWDRPYLNLAALAQSPLSAEMLLAQAKNIERGLGREAGGVWSPREIDIDILAMHDMVLDTPQLSVPHRNLLKRDFALLPLAELAPRWRYPVPGEYFGQEASVLAESLGFSLGSNLRDTGERLDG